MKSQEQKNLRQKAEQLLKEKYAEKSVLSTEASATELMYELELQQIELELQYQELQNAKASAQTYAEKYAHLYDFAPAAYFTLNKNLQICELNFTAAIMLGHERSTLTNSSFSSFVSIENQPLLNNFISQVFKTQIRQSCELQLFPAEKPALFVHLDGIVSSNGQQCLITAVDVSEQRQRDVKIHFQASLLNAVGQAVIATNLDGTVVYFNQAAEKLYGWPATDAMGCNILDINVPDISQAQAAEIMKELNAGNAWTGEFNVKRRDGTIFAAEVSDSPVMDEAGKLTGIVGISTDITNRKQAEETLIKSEENHRNLLQNLHAGVVVHAADSSIQFANEQASQLLGFSIGQLMGKTVNDPLWHFVQEDLTPMPVAQYPVQYVITKQIPLHEKVMGILRPETNELVWVLANALPEFETDGSLKQVVVTFIDITSRRKAEEALRESEEKYRQIVNTAGEGIWEIDAEGNTTFANEKMGEMLGYSVDEMMGCALFNFMDEESMVIAAANIERRRQGIKEQHDFKFRRKDGTYVWTIIETIPINNKDGHYAGALAMLTDISNRKKAEETLIKSEENYRHLLQNLHAGVVVHAADSSIQFANEQATKLLGLSLSQLMGKTAIDPAWHFMQEDLTPMPLAQYPVQFVIARQIPLRDQVLGINRPETNDMVWVLINAFPEFEPDGSLRQVVVTFIDITERKLAEEELRKNAERLAFILEKTSGGVCDWNIQTGTAKFSYQYTDMLGYEPEEFAKHYDEWEIVVHPDDLQRVKQEINIHFTTNTEFSIEFRMKEKSGGWHWIHARGILERDSNGNPLRMIITHNDIQERKLFEEALTKSEEQFRSIFNNLQDAFFQADITGRFTVVSPSALRMYGFDSLDEIIGQPAELLYGDKQGRENLIAELEAKEHTEDFVTTGKKKDGSTFWVSMNIRYLRNSENEITGTEGVVRDISERKLAEAELIKAKEKAEENEDRLNAFINSIPDLICYKDGTGKWLLANDADLELFHLKGVDYFGKTDLELAEFTNDMYKNAFETCMVTDEEAWNKKIISKGIEIIPTVKGEQKVFEAYKVPVFQANGERKGLAVIGRDITQLYETQQNLIIAKEKAEKNERELKKAQHIAQLGSWYLDLATNKVNWTEELYHMYGFDPASPVPPYNEHMKLFTPESWDILSTALDNTIKTGIPYELELKTVRKDGSSGWMWVSGETVTDTDGKTIGLWGAAQDITERKSAVEALKDSEEKYRSIFENSSVAILLTLPDGRILSANDYACRLFARTEHEICEAGRNGLLDLSDARLPILIQQIENTGHANGELTFLKKDGSKFECEISLVAFTDIEGNKRTSMVIRNLTEQKLAEQQILDLNQSLENKVAERTAQLSRANKELESFSYSVSHDLRAPLRALDGFANILIQDYADVLDEEGKRFLNIIISNANRMGVLIDDLLAFSRLGQQEIQQSLINMKSLAWQVFNESVEKQEASEINFQLHDIPDAWGDASMMRQVWINLISNAIKFTSRKQDRVIQIGHQLIDGSCIYYVKDNGAGFDMEFSNKLFAVFQRLHSPKEFEGTGIGLANVNRIIQRHKGSVWGEGKVDEGATIYFKIPILNQ